MNNKIKISVLSLSLLTVMAGAAVAPALGTISAHFTDVPQTIIKLIITIPALMIILTSVLFSLLITRFSPKAITIAGLLLYIVGGACAGLANNIYLLLVFRVLLGIGVGLIMPLSTGFLTILFDKKEQSRLMGYSSAMNNLGGIIATSLSGVLVAMNWRYSFLIYLLGIVVFLLILFFLPNVTFTKSDTSEKSTLTKSDFKTISPNVFIIFMVMIIFYALPSNFSMIATNAAIVPIALVGLLMAVQNLTAFLIGMKLDLVLNILRGKASQIAVLTLIAGFLLESTLSSHIATISGLVLIGFGLGIIIPVTNSQIANSISRNKIASAMSVMSAFLFLGQFLSPFIIDALSSGLKLSMLQSPYYLAAGISTLLFILLLFLPSKTTKTNNYPPA